MWQQVQNLFLYVPQNARGGLFKLTPRRNSGYLRLPQGKYLNSCSNITLLYNLIIDFLRCFGYIYKVYLNNIDKLYILYCIFSVIFI